MSIIASIILAVIYIVRERKASARDIKLRQQLTEQSAQIREMQDAIAASPFVTYPYVYTNATRNN
jgi:hypothetical protein